MSNQEKCPVENCDCRPPRGASRALAQGFAQGFARGRRGHNPYSGIPPREEEEAQTTTSEAKPSTPTSVLNEKFSRQVTTLRKKALAELDAILIFHESELYLVSDISSNNHKCLGRLYLVKYNLLKELAHGLIYYSIKHKTLYQSFSELCGEVKERYSTPETKPYFEYSLELLMAQAAQFYSQELHDAVQKIKFSRFGGVWPERLLVLVSGPASPRFGHPAMQYFARLTNTQLEMPRILERSSEQVSTSLEYIPTDKEQYPGRKLFYIENAGSLEKVLNVGSTLYVEDTVYDRYASMKTDILARPTQEYLREKCDGSDRIGNLT